MRPLHHLCTVIALLWAITANCMAQSAQPPEQNARLLNELSRLLDTLNISHEKTLTSITKASQVWRRSPTQERWNLPELLLSDEKRTTVKHILQTLNMTGDLLPSRKRYKYALLLGATMPTMKARFDHLQLLWKQGVRFDHLVFLTGQRPLTENIDKPEKLLAKALSRLPITEGKLRAARPIHETEAAMLIYYLATMPNEMQDVPVNFVDTPRRWEQDHWQRANTRDTLKSWMKLNPPPGPTLIISSQPHALYQLEVIRQDLPKNFLPDVSSSNAPKNTLIAVYLDALALWLHVLNQE